MFKAAKNGNVTAQKAFIAMTPGVAAPPLEPQAIGKKAKLGKKERANLEAGGAQVGTAWEDLLAPQRVQ
jgi:hypothetical protein